MSDILDTIIVGGGQSALACAYFFRRTNLTYLILDDNPEPGGAWLKAWDSLTLFSPPEFSNLPGYLMPKSQHKYPTREEVISYLKTYEERYKISVERPVHVMDVCFKNNLFEVKTNNQSYFARTVISATGILQKPYIPSYTGQEMFKGLQLHSSQYKNPQQLKGKKVIVIGGGNSGAQVLAEVSKIAHAKWITLREPSYLPDDVDGRVLFDLASAKYYALQKGEPLSPEQYNLGSIVMMPSVLEARERGVLHTLRPFDRFYEQGVIWPDGSKEEIDAVIWCTGFGYALDHLQCLNLVKATGKIVTNGTRATEQPGLWLVGYGGWTGFASATLIGVGRSARETVKEIQEYLQERGT
ncbi:ArsO family NAD(P)H-dependent flavin-containing monooxygenase [Pontibacter silvestris]|uniref:ArsO family NAD(P)H-dependent flavin-containing monooxygenase n=1 Tax=Pontibacter silvestris TaxID=2305183 RepID=A0ABW4X2I7_9BACT|nr:ArsO family NAD(P)H-dependent flavin-containing monooxygenase [Pontibacter silvestris]MCC9134826.1 ArsO family NAD(P)H-dependent flavin-containing monooxygenase [Pontibacter silvestris]